MQRTTDGYWFAINSEVEIPKNPGKEPEKLTVSTHPLLQLHRLVKFVPNAKSWNQKKLRGNADKNSGKGKQKFRHQHSTSYTPPTPIVPIQPEIPEQPVQLREPQTPALQIQVQESSSAAVSGAGAMTGLCLD